MSEVWVLTSGEYSDYSIDGVFPDEATARRVEAELLAIDGEDKYGSYHVESTLLLSAEARAEKVTRYYRMGLVGFDGEEERRRGSETITTDTQILEPGLVDLTACDVKLQANTLGYPNAKLAAQLIIRGVDIERCRKVWSEQHARLLAAPGPIVARLWLAHLGPPPLSESQLSLLDNAANAPIRDVILAGSP